MKLPFERAACFTLGMLLAAFTTAPAKAQWQGNTAQAAADTYCASRAAGNDDRQASRDAYRVMSTMAGNGNIPNMFATVLGSGRQQVQTVKYLITKTCPEYSQVTEYRPQLF